MKRNVGSIDKIIRLIIAIVAVWAAYTHQVASPWDYVLYAVAVIMVLTAVVGTCPIYSVLGKNTCKIS